jgi:hypothetical protein
MDDSQGVAEPYQVSVPAVTRSGPPVFTSHYLTLHNFHRDVVSKFTLDIQAIVSEFDLKTWGFLLYPDCSSDHSPDLDILVWQILKDRILPLAQPLHKRTARPKQVKPPYKISKPLNTPKHDSAIKAP